MRVLSVRYKTIPVKGARGRSLAGWLVQLLLFSGGTAAVLSVCGVVDAKKKRRNRQFEIAWLPWRPYETVLASLSHGLRSPVQKATLSVQLVIHHRPFSSCNQAAALCFRMLRIEVAHHHAARWAVSGIHCRWKTSHRAVPIVSG